MFESSDVFILSLFNLKSSNNLILNLEYIKVADVCRSTATTSHIQIICHFCCSWTCNIRYSIFLSTFTEFNMYRTITCTILRFPYSSCPSSLNIDLYLPTQYCEYYLQVNMASNNQLRSQQLA